MKHQERLFIVITMLLLLSGGAVLLKRTISPTEQDLGIIFKTPSRYIAHYAFDPGATFLALADDYGEVDIVRMSDGQRIRKFTRPEDIPTPLGTLLSPDRGWVPPGRGSQVAYSPDGHYLAHAGTFGVRVWRMDRGEPMVLANAPTGPVGAMLFLPDGRLQVWAAGGTIYRWQLPDNSAVAYPAPLGAAEDWRFGGAGRWLVGCRVLPSDQGIKDVEVVFWSVEESSETRVTIPQVGYCRDLALSPDGELLVVKSGGYEYRLVGRRDGQVRHLVELHFANDGGGIGFAPAGDWVVLGGNKRLSIRDTRNGRERGTLRVELPPLTYVQPIRFGAVTVSQDGRFIAALCGDIYLRVWRR